VGLVLLVLAWPGWLQPKPYRARGWRVEADDSMVRLAEVIRQWHDEEKVPADRFALTFSPEAAHHLAWFCPAEKGFLDSRWVLFDGLAEDFVRMRRCLLQSGGAGPDPALGPLLDAYRIDRIILRDPDWDRTARCYRCLLGGAEWELLALEGGAAVFGRRPGRPREPSGAVGAARLAAPTKAFNARRRAYHPVAERRAPPAPARPPERPGLLAAFRRGDERSPDREEAALHLISFDHAAAHSRMEMGAQWLLAQAAGLLGCPVPAGEWTATATAVAVRLALTPLLHGSQESAAPGQRAADQVFAGFVARRDQGPAEVLLLAVRAGRRALAVNPDDAGALLLLGEAYLRLARQTREQSWHANLPTLTAIRRLQALTALEQAVLLRPELDEAHALLVQLYGSSGYLDRALDHARARLRIVEQQAGKRGPGRTLAAERRSALAAERDTLQELVNRSLKVYEANATEMSEPSKVYDRARLAYRHGLAGKALEMLLGSHPAIFGKAGAQLQLDLMLELGRAYEVRAWLEPEHESVLGFSSYHWLRAQAAAACGDYAEAEAELDRASEEWRQVGVSATRLLPVRTVIALRVAEAVLTRPDVGAGPAGLVWAVLRQFDALRPLGGPAGLLRKEADILVLRGVLALECGDVETARRHCRAALSVWGDEHRAATSAGLDFAARTVSQRILELLVEK
jgi:tetratricopeptide (TPR) repeat protein